jgi:hypothetical protein
MVLPTPPLRLDAAMIFYGGTSPDLSDNSGGVLTA